MYKIKQIINKIRVNIGKLMPMQKLIVLRMFTNKR